MSHLAQISALIGAGMPILIAVVLQHHWSRKTKTIIGTAASVIAATVAAALHGDLTLHTWATSLIAVYGASQVTYRNLWEPLGAAPWLEEKTTAGGASGPSS